MIPTRIVSKAVRAVVVLAAVAVLAARSARADDTVAIISDTGTFRVYQGARALGTEVFEFLARGDSVRVVSHVHQVLGDTEADSLQKAVSVVANLDYGLRQYESYQRFRGLRIHRKLVLGDTIFVAYREENDRGTGETLVRPPGRLFVIDAQLFVLFDLMSRNLSGQSFESRPLSLVVLGTRDTVLEATATRLGIEPIRWGASQVQAQKYRIADAGAEFLLWADPRGRMLRLTQPAVELRVERDPPKVPAKRKPPRAG